MKETQGQDMRLMSLQAEKKFDGVGVYRHAAEWQASAGTCPLAPAEPAWTEVL
jgi:hypothetical protein